MNEAVRDELLALKRADPGTEYVFKNARTGSYVHDVKRAFTGACRDAKVEDFRFHDLRHMAATRMADAGVHPAAIREILGHASFKMTGVYMHATPEMMHQAVGALNGPTRGSLHQFSTKQQKAREDESRADALTT